MQNVLCPQMCQNHQTFISCSLVHNFHMCNNNYIAIYTQRTLLDMNISYFPNQHYWFPLLENLGTCKLSCLKHCQDCILHKYHLHLLPKQSQENTQSWRYKVVVKSLIWVHWINWQFAFNIIDCCFMRKSILM